MLREFSSRFFPQLLEVRAFLSEPALQGPRAQVQFARDILQSWPLTSEKFLHNSFHLFRERFLSQLLGQFGLQLRRDQGQEFGVVCQEGLIDVRSIEDEHVVTRRISRDTENEIRTFSGKIPDAGIPRAWGGPCVRFLDGRW